MRKWFFNDRFSWFDLIMIFITIEFFNWMLSHLTWN